MYSALVLIYILPSVLAASNIIGCDSNKCYQSLNTSHENLLDLIKRFNETTSHAKVSESKDLKEIENDVKQVKGVENKVKKANKKLEDSGKKLSQTEANVAKDQKTVDKILDILANISKYNVEANRIVKEAKEKQTDFENLLKLGENASETCRQAHDKYSQFKNLIDGILKDYDDVAKSYDEASKRANELNKKLDESFEETVATRKKFEDLELPANLVKDYLLDAENKINETLQHLKDNFELLKDIMESLREDWNAKLKLKWQKLVDEIAEIQEDINKMKQDLDTYEDAFVDDGFEPTVDDVSIDLLRQIRGRIYDLERQLASIDFSEEEKKAILQDSGDIERDLDNVRRLRKELKEYRTVLDSVPISEEEMEEVRKIIKDLRDRVDLFEEWKRVKKELEILRKNRDEIVKIECINGNNSGLLT